jgi:hypothetical protein
MEIRRSGNVRARSAPSHRHNCATVGYPAISVGAVVNGCRAGRTSARPDQESPPQVSFGLVKRRGRDLNPRRMKPPETVFEFVLGWLA